MVVVLGIERSEESRAVSGMEHTRGQVQGQRHPGSRGRSCVKARCGKSEFRHVAFDVMAEMSRNWLWNQEEAKASNVQLPKDGCELSREEGRRPVRPLPGTAKSWRGWRGLHPNYSIGPSPRGQEVICGQCPFSCRSFSPFSLCP